MREEKGKHSSEEEEGERGRIEDDSGREDWQRVRMRGAKEGEGKQASEKSGKEIVVKNGRSCKENEKQL